MADSALTVATRLLTRREHTRRELEQKLQQRQFRAAEISAALQRLQETDLQSDRRFCEAYIRQQGRRFGDWRLRAELEKRGAAAADIAAALTAAALAAEESRARAVLEKKYPHGVDAAAQPGARRFLAGRGFASDSIRAALSAPSG